MNYIGKKQLFRTVLTSLVFLTGLTAVAQDKLANIAPIDRKIKGIDSVAIVRLRHFEESLEMPASALYPFWNNQYSFNYGVTLPSEFKIDLRNFCMPTDSRLVTSHYGYRRSFRRMHYGTDIKVYVGDTIRAAFSGKVRIVDYERAGYGRYVVIRHPNGLETLYGHMSKQLVDPNQVVKAGEPIGLGGNTGRSTGSHLHFETRFLGQFINPELLFDFEAQDVLGDYYVYRSNGRGTMLVSKDVSGGEAEMSESDALAMEEKNAESRQFQRDRIAQQRTQRSQVHKVERGESLYTIARKRGVTIDKLCRLNGISRRSVLRPGQILKCS